MAAGRAPRGVLAPFVVEIPSWQIVAAALACVSSFVHYCVLHKASYSLRTLIGLAGLSLFLSSTTASELASQDDTGVQQLLWCLCTSILTDNYDPNADALAWKRVLWMLSTWLQLALMFRRTSIASSTAQQLLFQAVVVLKGMKLHFLHGWHCSSWDETKDDSKTQCEHLAAVATWKEIDWSKDLERVETASATDGTEIGNDGDVFFWRSILEGKPRRAGEYTKGRDCCDIAVKFKQPPSAVIPAVAFSIKRQFKAKLGSMASLSAQYSVLASCEMALALSIIILMLSDLRREGKRTLPSYLCLCVWFLELLYHIVSCRRAFDLWEEVNKQSNEVCRSRRFGPHRVTQTCLVITDLILGSISEAFVTGLASIGVGAKVWMTASNASMMKRLVEIFRWVFAVGIVMPMAFLAILGKYLHDLLNGLCKNRNISSCLYDFRLVSCVNNLRELQKLVRRYADEMSLVERTMYPSVSGTTADASSLEAPPEPTSPPVTRYSLTALEAVLFSQLLGQAATLALAERNDESQSSLLPVWMWTFKAFKDGMVDSSWLSPNISRAMWHAATLEQSEVWHSALSDVRQALVGEINPSAEQPSSSDGGSKALGSNLASLEGARRAVLHLITKLDSELQRTRKVDAALRAGLFAVVAFCQEWGGPETVAVPGPLEHECLMACFVSPAFKDDGTTRTRSA